MNTQSMSRAGGKVIICGEHAVVHGRDAIAVGLPDGVRAFAAHAEEFGLRINNRVLSPTDPSVEALERLYETVARGKPRKRVYVTLDVTMPLGVGLGGSAAMAVAIARAIAELDQTPLPLPDLLAAAAAWERVFHGNPSGVDAAAAALGGCLRYNRHTGATPLAVHSPLYLALAVAAPPSLTKEMVARVAAHRERDPGRFALTLDAIQAIVVQAEHCLRTGTLDHLGHLLDENHRRLTTWDLSTDAIDAACRLARDAGALGAKLTGAGGGGCVLALCTETTLPAVGAAWSRNQFESLSAIIPATDVAPHSIQ